MRNRIIWAAAWRCRSEPHSGSRSNVAICRLVATDAAGVRTDARRNKTCTKNHLPDLAAMTPWARRLHDFAGVARIGTSNGVQGLAACRTEQKIGMRSQKRSMK
jgi:hypothetical protein